MVLSTSQFWATFLAAIKLYSPDLLDPNLRTPNTPQSEVAAEYDFIIAGAGSAGCVLANRLTENPDWKVLLIEAGSTDDYISDTPLLAQFLSETEKDWNYTVVPQKRACLSRDGLCKQVKGRVIGGSSTVNWMMYTRGNKADFDGWEQLGNHGWGYKDVLPYFIKAENMTEPRLANSKFHGRSGPLNVQYPRYITPMRDEYIKAGQELGWNFTDYNGEEQKNSIDYLQQTLNGPLRESTVKSYLDPIKNRKNLHIIMNSVVNKIIIENKMAKGVEYHRDGNVYQVFSKKDVILSTGAFETAKLLMLSGIGPKKHLQHHNIDVVMDLPVGQIYQDHIYTSVFFELNDKAKTITEREWRTNESILAYAKYGEGPLTMTTSGTEAVSFFNPLEKNKPPSIQTVYCSAAPITMDFGSKRIVMIMVVNIYPNSIGSLKLRSGDFRDSPLLDPNIFDNEIDKKVLQKGVEKAFEFMETKTMTKYSPKLYTENIHPKCQGKSHNDYIACIVSQYSGLTERPFGTARMGPKDKQDTVVCSEDLIVKGLTRLRVVDASIMPKNPRANTNAAVIMLAEKAADIIKNHHQIDQGCDEDYNVSSYPTYINETEFGEINDTNEAEQEYPGGNNQFYKPNFIHSFLNNIGNIFHPNRGG